MKREFAVPGPVRVQVRLRTSDLLVAEGDIDTATVVLESSRDAADFAANTVVELVGDVLHVQAPAPRMFSRDRTRVHITVPAGSSVDIVTGSGEVRCAAPLARVTVRSGSGGVLVTAADDVDIVTGSGTARLGSVRAGRVQTGSGDVWVGTVHESLSARTGSGDITVASARRLESTSGSGDIVVEELEGEARLRSASGDVTVRRAVSGRLDTKSTSGDCRVAVTPGTAVHLDCGTVSGRMRSELSDAGEPAPGDPTLELSARTVSGHLLVERAV